MVRQLFKYLSVDSMVVDVMLLNGDNRALLYYPLVWVAPPSNRLIPMHKGNNIIAKHRGTWGLVCSA